MLSVIMLSIIMLSAIMMNIFMLNVVMQNVVAPWAQLLQPWVIFAIRAYYGRVCLVSSYKDIFQLTSSSKFYTRHNHNQHNDIQHNF
jgi:hypothetical protein